MKTYFSTKWHLHNDCEIRRNKTSHSDIITLCLVMNLSIFENKGEVGFTWHSVGPWDLENLYPPCLCWYMWWGDPAIPLVLRPISFVSIQWQCTDVHCLLPSSHKLGFHGLCPSYIFLTTPFCKANLPWFPCIICPRRRTPGLFPLQASGTALLWRFLHCHNGTMLLLSFWHGKNTHMESASNTLDYLFCCCGSQALRKSGTFVWTFLH